MKNLLVITQSAGSLFGANGSAVASNNPLDTVVTLEKLTRGKYLIEKADGTLVTSVPTTGMYRYIVGLGENKHIHGLWLNAENKQKEEFTYNNVKGAAKTVTIASAKIDAASVGDIQLSQEATLHIQTQPRNVFAGYPLQVFTATVVISSTTQSESDIATALVNNVKKIVANINKHFGKTVLSVTGDALVGLKFTAADAEFDFSISFGGAITGTLTVTDGLAFGTKAQIVKLEKELAIKTFGYNPNFEDEGAYGNVFLAPEITTEGCNVYVISSVAPATDRMSLHPDGAKVEQWIAVPSTTTLTV